MGYLSETNYIGKLAKVFSNVPIELIKRAIQKYSNEAEQNEYLRKQDEKYLKNKTK